MKRVLPLSVLFAFAAPIQASPFDLSIAGEGLDVRRQIEIGELGAGPTDVAFQFPDKDGNAYTLESERLVLDILVPKFDFQMIRPVIVPSVGPDQRSQSYSLDRHPYEVNYTLKDLGAGQVEVQSNLSRKDGDGMHLMQRVYFHAADLDTLREAMYASKFFDAKDGTFKLVYYPAMGQTEPARH